MVILILINIYCFYSTIDSYHIVTKTESYIIFYIDYHHTYKKEKNPIME